MLFLHGDGTAAASASWLEQIAALGLRCFSHREIDGVEKTEATLHQFGALCAEIADQAPGQALLVLRAGLELNAELLQALGALLDRAPGVSVYTLLSNASPAHNPFAGLPYPANPESRRRLLRWLGSNRLYLLDQWPSHFLALTTDAVDALADTDLPLSAAAGRLRARR
ncbi:MAG: hypothetical protein HRU51_08565, partial [Xanthomonadales bacterium]|nr:hypothetical protein [Xanthomonadales bacterium]